MNMFNANLSWRFELGILPRQGDVMCGHEPLGGSGGIHNGGKELHGHTSLIPALPACLASKLPTLHFLRETS